MSKKSSAHISLVLASILVLSGCGSEENRPIYRTKQECLDDWGRDNKDCEEMDKTHTMYRPGYYWGPRYSGSSRMGSGGRSIGTATISRGGFGGLSHFHSSGG